jgi:hypothetical protein
MLRQAAALPRQVDGGAVQLSRNGILTGAAGASAIIYDSSPPARGLVATTPKRPISDYGGRHRVTQRWFKSPDGGPHDSHVVGATMKTN